MREVVSGIQLERALGGGCSEERHHGDRISPLRLVPLLVALLVTTAPSFAGQLSSAVDAAELQLALDKLQHLGSVLYVSAHPDDENTALLGYLARGRLARTAYLSITRGDGGQNLLGAEIGERLGLIRTQELLQARRQDGAEQYFTRAIDFGYTKSVDESLEVWGREEILGDVVRVIRRFRPDVIITRFPGDGRGGHGQHTASAVLAFDGFAAAADPARFPEQLSDEGHQTWQAKRLLWDASRFFGRDTNKAAPNEIVVDIGEYQPLLGESFGEIAARSRSMHKSQGFGSAPRRGAQPSHLEHRFGEQATGDLFDGVDTSWNRIAGGEAVGRLLAEARRSFDPAHPAAVVPTLMRAWSALAELPSSPWVDVKRAELREVVRAAAGLWLDVRAERATATPEEAVELTVEIVNRSELPFRFTGLELPFEAAARNVDLELPRNEAVTVRQSVTVPAEEPPTQPYWLELPHTPGRYQVADPALIGLPEDLRYQAVLTVSLDDTELPFELPVVYRWTDRVDGERYRPFVVTPPVLVEVEEAVQLFPDAQSRPFGVVVRRPEGSSGEAQTGSVHLALPAGWQATPGEVPFSLAAGASQRVEVAVTPPAASATGTVRAEAVLDGERSMVLSRGMASIEYSHIPTQVLFPPAEARLVRLELHTAKRRLGYVMGAGDDIPEALRGVGYEVVLLDDEQLATGDLGEYETIVVGVRAYNVRAALREHNDRLLDYVAAGGTLVVQYNTVSYRGPALSDLGPYPFSISRDRVSVETAPVTLVDPDQPLLQRPNRIAATDFEDWVQERGLYFAGSWDEHFTPLLASHDPSEPDRLGGLLLAHYGKGVYIYTGYSFFRQLPAGVPGAFRLFVNLIEAG